MSNAALHLERKGARVDFVESLIYFLLGVAVLLGAVLGAGSTILLLYLFGAFR